MSSHNYNSQGQSKVKTEYTKSFISPYIFGIESQCCHQMRENSISFCFILSDSILPSVKLCYLKCQIFEVEAYGHLLLRKFQIFEVCYSVAFVCPFVCLWQILCEQDPGRNFDPIFIKFGGKLYPMVVS